MLCRLQMGYARPTQTYEAFLYDSNFGIRELMFRLPEDLVDVDLCEPYLIEDWITLENRGRYSVLHIEINDESDFFEWIESEGILGQLTPLREQLLQGVLFTIHSDPYEPFGSDDMERIIIPRRIRSALKNTLNKYGVDRFSLFPGLDGLAAYIEWLQSVLHES